MPLPEAFVSRPRTGRLLVACAALATTAVHAQWGPAEISGSAELIRRTLVERTAGTRLLTEDGPMARVGLRAVWPWGEQAAAGVAGTFALAALDYDGRTSTTNVPLFTRTRHAETEVDLVFSPARGTPLGEFWLSLGLLDNRRLIRATTITPDLYERSDALMVGLRWKTPPVVQAAGWSLGGEAEFKASLTHRLHVNFYGALSPSKLALRGGNKELVRLRLVAARAGSPWEWAAEWSRLSQGVSASGSATGLGQNWIVFQPELTVRDVGLKVTRRF